MLSVYRHNKPGRYKNHGGIEGNRGTPIIDPVLEWSVITTTIFSVLKKQKDERAKKAFTAYYLSDDEHRRAFQNITDLASDFGVSKSKMYKDLNKILDALEKEMRERRIIE